MLVPFAGIGPATSPLPRECSTTEPKGHKTFADNTLQISVERGRRIELLALAWKAKVLPLYEPRKTFRKKLLRNQGCIHHWWRGLDSNQRTLTRADLQSAAINHSATSPKVSRELCHQVLMFRVGTKNFFNCAVSVVCYQHHPGGAASMHVPAKNGHSR